MCTFSTVRVLGCGLGFVIVAACGAVDASPLSAVVASVVKSSASALSVDGVPASFEALDGDYGEGCTARAGSWSVPIGAYDGALDHDPLSVVLNDTSCVLTVTSVQVNGTARAASTGFAIGADYGPSMAMFPTSGKPFYANFKLTPADFSAAFAIAMSVSEEPNAVVDTATGSLVPAPRTFQGEYEVSNTVPGDAMGAVGPAHIVTASNDRIRIQTRDGIELSRIAQNAFWTGTTVNGTAVANVYDTKVYFDRYDGRFIMVAANYVVVNAAVMIAVSQTADPTGAWNRFAIVTDPTATSAGGLYTDIPAVGFNKNWIVVTADIYPYGTAGSGLDGTHTYVLDKQAAYANTLSYTRFAGSYSACGASAAASNLGCGWSRAPSVSADDADGPLYLVEDWDNLAGQLRVSKITGTASAPVLTVGTQFPQSPYAWQRTAARISTSGGYAPQRNQSANSTATARLMVGSSNVQNAVLRNGSLWCAQTVMLAAAPTLAGGTFGAANPDQHSGVQWWQLDPAIETGLPSTPLQRAIIEDPTADNCFNGTNGNRIGACSSTTTQVGRFFAFPTINVNRDNDVVIGFSQLSKLTYPSAAYAFRAGTDAINTTRAPVVYRAGQANYNLGVGSGSARQNYWGTFSATMTDPLNDTDFWTIQASAGAVRDFGYGRIGNWESWWANIRPSTAAPSTSGSLLISQFRLRGPQGTRDEFVELYNPGDSALIVNTTDNSDGWTLGYSSNGVTVTAIATIPAGTVIPAKGHFLFADDPDSATASTAVYSLNAYPGGPARTASGDIGWSLDLADNGGLAIFKTSTTGNFNASTRMDSVGFSSIASGLFKEGTGIPTTTGAPTGQIAFVRKRPNGIPHDTDDNATDFLFLDPVAETLGATPQLGSPGPQNLDSPVSSPGALTVAVVDSASCATCGPNAVRDTTSDAPNSSTFGTIEFRAQITNGTANDLTRVRFRIYDITTRPESGVADLRARTSANTNAAVSGDGGAVTIEGTTLESPPAQAIGGGYNATFSFDGVSASTPFLRGTTRYVRFLLGVESPGALRFGVSAEVLPGGSGTLSVTGNTDPG